MPDNIAPVGPLDLVLPQGATFNPLLTYQDSDSNAIDLTGYTARMQARKSHKDSDTLFSLTESSGITLGGAAGTIQITIAATTTAGYTAGKYVYDLEIESGSGVVTRLVEGTLTVTAEVTR